MEETVMLPKDPFMLLSMINMKLRDQYSSMDELCDDLNEDKAEINKKLESAGFTYDKEVNQYR